MELNLLECRRDTILNVEDAIEKIVKMYGKMGNYPIQIELDFETIYVYYLGRKISIPYYKKVEGNLLNKEELKLNPLGTPIYDSFKCRSLSTDEIFEIIVNSFNKNFDLEIKLSL